MSQTISLGGIAALPVEIILKCVEYMDDAADVYRLGKTCGRLWRCTGLESIIQKDIELQRAVRNCELESLRKYGKEFQPHYYMLRWKDIQKDPACCGKHENRNPFPILLHMIRTNVSTDIVRRAIKVYGPENLDLLQGYWGREFHTPLNEAVRYGRQDVLQELLGVGCSIQGTKYYEVTFSRGRVEKIKLDWGNPDFLMLHDSLEIALQGVGDEDMALYLLEKGFPFHSGHFILAASLNLPRVIEAMLQLRPTPKFPWTHPELKYVATDVLPELVRRHLRYARHGRDFYEFGFILSGKPLSYSNPERLFTALLHAGAVPSEDLLTFYLTYGSENFDELKRVVAFQAKNGAFEEWMEGTENDSSNGGRSISGPFDGSDRPNDFSWSPPERKATKIYLTGYLNDRYLDWIQFLHDEHPIIVSDPAEPNWTPTQALLGRVIRAGNRNSTRKLMRWLLSMKPAIEARHFLQVSSTSHHQFIDVLVAHCSKGDVKEI